MISIPDLRAAEGKAVTVVLTDGTRVADCVIVSVGRLWARSVWLVKEDIDVFTSPEEIAELVVPEARQAA